MSARIAALAVIAVASCSPAGQDADTPAPNAAESTKTPSPKSFDGWGSFKFGMSFDNALTAEAGIRWDGRSFRECQDEMPIRGCTLWASDESYVPMTAGVALLPHLQFNQMGELTTVNMTKRLEGDIAPAQCERAHGQLLDYLESEWGAGKSREERPSDMLIRTTPKGRTFYRTPLDETVFVMDSEDFNELPDGRRITIISHYSVRRAYSPARCWLSIYFDGPKSLERPAHEKPKELEEVAPDPIARHDTATEDANVEEASAD